MREILFRGKRLDNGEWVEGWAFPFTNGGYAGKDSRMCIRNGMYAKDIYEVDPATIGQYTGLTDSYGKKIFEGDICDFSVFDLNDYDIQYRGVVVYDVSRFMLWKNNDSEYYGSDGGFDLDWVLAQDDEFKVLGNCWDNPELLEASNHA